MVNEDETVEEISIEDKNDKNAAELEGIEARTLKLAEELQSIKKQLQQVVSRTETSSKLNQDIEMSTILNYLSELVEKASERIIKEMKVETFKIWNAITGSQPMQILQSMTDDEKTSKKEDVLSKDVETKSTEPTISLYKDLLEERETLIYELTDQMVAIESENKELKERLQKIEEETTKTNKFMELVKKFLKTDPRYRIINTVRRTGIIAPVQLSFVLGISLAQTNQYLKEMEKMGIIEILSDGTVTLHKEFDEAILNELF
ncbi:MAG: winged helix-turn-helix domain-containing protein [Candidatus Heimdallarchaeaceae archaeon]